MAVALEAVLTLSCEHVSNTADWTTQGGPPTQAVLSFPGSEERVCISCRFALEHVLACCELWAVLVLSLPFASCLWICPKVFFFFNISFGWESIECHDARHIQPSSRWVAPGQCDCFPDNSKLGPELMTQGKRCWCRRACADTEEMCVCVFSPDSYIYTRNICSSIHRSLSVCLHCGFGPVLYIQPQ